MINIENIKAMSFAESDKTKLESVRNVLFSSIFKIITYWCNCFVGVG